ncbi:hypothetical protein PH210_07500 [Paenibacillus sp. BSR1-1]|uniref:hypothetical protein n=1 Tax=Paenibacillus sp. BSR1-1 TaxID=3020845 RepID=UPI0025B0A1A0|nr:hypothetical protein [Paenibacillus sp. BSR1-1]MDN3016052.1 hypothetical protein [Paenibacillus sp. BSR1-1]
MDILLSFIHTLLLSLIELFYLVGSIIAAGLLLGIFEKYSNTFLIRTFGPKGVLVTAWIGTPIHEIGHLIQCFLWGHRVTRVKLLQLNSSNGVLGFVEHQYNRNSLYQQVGNFFIGLGPIFSGIGSLILGMYLFVPQSFITFQQQLREHVSFERLDINVIKSIVGAILAISKSLFTIENFINPLFWIFLVIAISISSHIALSKSDIQGSAKGLLTIFFLLVLLNLASGLLHLDSYRLILKLAEYNAYVLALSGIAFLFSLFTLVLSYIVYQIKKGL